MRPYFDLSLYFVTDRQLMHGRSFAEVLPPLIEGGVTICQLREKYISSNQFYEAALEVKSILRRYSVPFIINDRVDIALAVGADGVHLGQDDLPCGIVRDMVPDHFIIGISASTPDEVRKAEADGADYIGIGAVFATATKTDAGAPVGCERISKIRRMTKLPIVGIGGITLENASQVINAGANGIAVVSALLNTENGKQTAQRFVAAAGV